MEEYLPQAKQLLSVLHLTNAWIAGFLVRPKTQKHSVIRHSIEKYLNSPQKSRAYYAIRARIKRRKLRALQIPPPIRKSLCTQEEYYQQCKKVEKRSRPKRVRNERNRKRACEFKQIVQNYTSTFNNFKRANPHYGRKEEVNYKSISYYGDPTAVRTYAIERAIRQVHLHKYNFATYKRLRRSGLRRITAQQVIENVTPQEARNATVHLTGLLPSIDYEKAIKCVPLPGSIVWKRVDHVTATPTILKQASYCLPSQTEMDEEREMHIRNRIRTAAIVNKPKAGIPPPRLYASETERQAAKRARSNINKNI